MTSWYPTTQFHHAMSPPTSGLAPDDHHSSRQESLNPGHVGYALSAAVSPSSSHRSSNSPPPSAVAPQLTTNNTTHHNQHHDPRHHDPNLYSYFPRESSNLRTVSSTEEQLQYHQWEIDQLLGSAQATPNYLSEYTSLSQHSFPPQYPSYPLSAYESRPIDHDQHSGYTSSSPPPSQVHVSHSSQINQPEAERNYEVIHHVFKPMTSDFKTSEYLPSPSSGHGHELYSQFHSMPYVTKGRFEKNPNGASRGQSTTTKKSTKENEKRFPCKLFSQTHTSLPFVFCFFFFLLTIFFFCMRLSNFLSLRPWLWKNVC